VNYLLNGAILEEEGIALLLIEVKGSFNERAGAVITAASLF
jgi:hypothetical protein